MRISSKTEYALKTLVDLAMHSKDGVTRIADIAKRQNIPSKFLEQILLILKSANIVGSQRGAKGGYFLAIKPSMIKLSAVVSLTDDSILSISHPDQHKGRSDRQISPFIEVWTDINSCIKQKLEQKTIQDMCERILELQNARSTEYVI